MSTNRVKLLQQMVQDAGLEIVDFIGTDANRIKARCKVPGFDESRIFQITYKEGDYHADRNEAARMRRFFRELNPEPVIESALATKLKEALPVFKSVAAVAPPVDWNESVLGKALTALAPAPAPKPRPEPITPVEFDPALKQMVFVPNTGRAMPVRLTTRQQAMLHAMLRWFEQEHMK